MESVGAGLDVEAHLKRILDSLTEMRKQIDRMFRELWREAPKEVSLGFYEPPVDIEDRGDEYVVYMDIPGFSKEELKIKATEDFLEVSAERSEERKRELASRNYVVRERVYEGFRRRIMLPSKVRPEMARAVLRNGVLEVHLPKSGAAREVEVSITD